MISRGASFKFLVSAVLLMVGCIDNAVDTDDDAGADEATDIALVEPVGPLPDLVVTTVGNPPASAVLGQTFSVSETVKNQGTADAGTTFTKYYLSSNGHTPLYLLGNRSVAALTVGSMNSGSATATVPNEVPVGSYFLVACADSGPGTGPRVSQVAESDESNNCTGSAMTVAVTGPDLTESNVTASPSTIDPTTGTLTVSDTVNNIGGVSAGASVTRWWLSTDNVKSANDAFIRNCTEGNAVPGRDVGTINAGGNNAGQATTTPLCVRDASGLHFPANGTYYVIACADTTNLVGETNENNNCAASSTTIQVLGTSGVDLVETAVSSPPATGTIGTTFPITDTVQNTGATAAPASFTKFYLSTNGTLLNVYLNTRSVGALAGGASDAATTSMTILAGTASGTYYVVACADSGPGTGGRISQIVETNENNNCTRSATTITLGSLPDLVITAISPPPAMGTVGQTFAITDTTKNNGGGNAGSFFNKYYLSSNQLPGGIKAWLGTGSAGALTAGASEIVTATGTIPAGVAPGTYWLVGCADAGPGSSGRISQIGENNEDNNCTASGTTITIGGQPDLLITAISNPPATGTAGTTFAITDTTKNQGGGAAPTFFNKYYLTSNGLPGGVKAYLATASAGALAAGASEMVAATATVPSGVAPGNYWLIGCADAGPGTSGRVSQIAESDENNNCTASAMQITIH
jgi:subtilase family serine protease